jgi:signal transduction histidine kinase
VATAHPDPHVLAKVAAAARRYDLSLNGQSQYGRIARLGRAECQVVPKERLPPELAEIGLRETIYVPLCARGRTLGMMNLALLRESSWSYTPADVRLAEELGARAALLLDNTRLYEEAQVAITQREDLIAMVSHDLKNPLVAIHMNAGALLPSKQAESILRASEKMEQLITDLLDLTRIDSGALALAMRPERADQLISEAVDLLMPLAEQNDQCLKTESLPESVLCDRIRILQVFSNLIGNAVRHTPHGGTISIGVAPPGSAKVVEFVVSDTGPGIPAGELPHIFDRYWRGERGDRANIGLGLTIARGIVEAHGGRIAVESKEGAGTTFRFTLPSVTIRS